MKMSRCDLRSSCFPDAAQNRTLWILCLLFFLVFTVTLFLKATQPISDPDFWWHLKTGEVTCQERTLLTADPFTFHSAVIESSREKIILRGYWLWEITAYGLYSLLGFNGIFLLNLLTIGSIATVLIRQMRSYSINFYLAAPLLTAGFYLFQIYPLERPHVVSFLFAIILVGMLLKVRQGKQPGFSLPLLLCIWSNIHGGFIIGIIILLCFIIGVVIEYRHDPAKMKLFSSWSVAGICATLINPNGYLAIKEVFGFYGHNLMTTVNEYSSTWVLFKEQTRIVIILWLLVVLYALGVCLLRKIFWPELLISLALAYLSVMHIRNIAFFSLAMLPVLARQWQEIIQTRQWRTPSFIKVISVSVAILLFAWLARINYLGWQPGIKSKQMYPDSAIDFIINNQLQGNMFNDYEYGGYLLWRLAPKIKVFIDGRGINTKVYVDYRKISNASVINLNNRKEYQVLLDEYKIDYIVHSICDGFGNVQPLMKGLLQQPEWVPVYLDSQVYILARNSDNNRDAIDRLRIDKDDFKYRLLGIYNNLCQNNPEQVGFRVARAGMLIYLNMYEEAAREVKTIEQYSPNDVSLPVLRRELRLLAIMRGQY